MKSYLGTTHHGYFGIWPKEHEVRTISTATHCIISSTEASTNDYSNFGNLYQLIGKGAEVNLFVSYVSFFFMVVDDFQVIKLIRCYTNKELSTNPDGRFI